METNFKIAINLRKPQDIITIGSFEMGNNHKFAEQVFKLLSGNHVPKKTVLSMELTSVIDEIQLPIAIKHCTLEQLTANIEIMTKELFKQHTLEEKE